MDLCGDHEQLKPLARKLNERVVASTRSGATQSSKREGSHYTSSTDGLESAETGARQCEENIPITTRTKTHLQQHDGRPLMMSTCSGNEVEDERARAPCQLMNRESAGSNSLTEPQPLDLKAIIREYIRRKEAATSILSSEVNEEGRDPILNSAIDKTVIEVADVVQDGNSVAFTEEEQTVSVSPPTAGSTPPIEQQHKPNDSDVLFGRGRAYRNHPGNVNLKRLVIRHQNEYETARYREDKTNLSWKIVLEMIGDGARFLKRNKADRGQWFEASEEEAREKVSHALRDWRKKPVPTPPKDPPPPPPSSTITPQPVAADAEKAARLLSALQNQQQVLAPSSTAPPR